MKIPLKTLLPAWGWLRTYRSAHFPKDLLAGLFVALLLIPQAMAYAQLAGLPPRMGVYAALAPPLLYALFGGSRFLSLGPVALVSLLVGEVVAQRAGQLGLPPGEVGTVLALEVGLVLTVMGLLRLGFLIRFISAPVLAGFVQAAALVIIGTQLRLLLGLDLPREGRFGPMLASVADHLPEAHTASLWLGLGCLLVLLTGPEVLPSLGRRMGISARWCRLAVQALPLIVLTVAAVVVRMDGGEGNGWDLVGSLDLGHPSLALPAWDLQVWKSLALEAVAIGVVGFITAMAVARDLADPDRPAIRGTGELVALGLANLGAAVTGGYPVGGSLSRSAVTREAGGRTALASALAAGWTFAGALALSPLVASLPRSALAALVIAAVGRQLRPTKPLELWRYSRADAISFVVAFAGVLVLGVEPGIVVGATAALVLYLWRTSRPRVVVEGRTERDERHFRSSEWPQVEAEEAPVLVLRVDQSLYFANAAHFETRVLELVAGRDDCLALLLDFKAVNDMDSSAVEILVRLVKRLRTDGLTIALAEIKRPLYHRMERSGFVENLGEECFFLTTHEALGALEKMVGAD